MWLTQSHYRWKPLCQQQCQWLSLWRTGPRARSFACFTSVLEVVIVSMVSDSVSGFLPLWRLWRLWWLTRIGSVGGCDCVNVSQWQCQKLSFIVTITTIVTIVMIVTIDKYRRLWLCQLWSVTDRVRGRVTSLPWSPARAAGSKVFPNLQTILFSTNKPKISTTSKVSFFPFLCLKVRELSASLDWENFSLGSELSYL